MFIWFLYQVCLILNHYTHGKTVVNIEVKMLKEQPLPAITICIPALLSIQKLSKSSRKNGNFEKLFDTYKNLVEQTRDVTSWNDLYLNINDIYTRITKSTILKRNQI